MRSFRYQMFIDNQSCRNMQNFKIQCLQKLSNLLKTFNILFEKFYVGYNYDEIVSF